MTRFAPLVAIVGPTASGKSGLAVSLAQRFGGEVLVCDSTQIYRGFDIGTGKPTIEERRGIPHHLMDLVEPTERFTAGEYRRRALVVLGELMHGKNGQRRLPIFTVGTGLYMRALLEGLADAPERCESLRRSLETAAAGQVAGYLHRMLQQLDPVAGTRIAPQDRQKLIRALEVCLLTGKPLTELYGAARRESLQGYAPLKIGLNPPRAELRRRIELRVYSMLERGWLAEAAGLFDSGLSQDSAKPLDFLGYRQLRAHLRDGQPLAEAIAEITVATRRYAKRQLTWFRKEPDVHWLDAFGDDPETLAAAGVLIEQHLTAFPASGRRSRI